MKNVKEDYIIIEPAPKDNGRVTNNFVLRRPFAPKYL